MCHKVQWLSENAFRVHMQPKRTSDSGGVVTGEITDPMSIQFGLLLIVDILELCGRKIQKKDRKIVREWRRELQWKRKTFHDLFSYIPVEEKYTIATTAQADMNISGGKTVYVRLLQAVSWTHQSNVSRSQWTCI